MPQSDGQKGKNKTKKKQKWSIQELLNVILIFITFGMACIAFWQTVVSNKATNTAIESLKLQDESIKIANRAYVIYQNLIPEGHPIPGTVHADFINTGNTPAYNLGIRGRFYVGKKEPNFKSMRPDTLKQGIILGKDKVVARVPLTN